MGHRGFAHDGNGKVVEDIEVDRSLDQANLRIMEALPRQTPKWMLWALGGLVFVGVIVAVATATYT